mgnify:CR=1 FL=1
MIDCISIKKKTIAPPLYLAPMAGVTHSAFRRLMADFGGYGALTTEMVSARALLNENIHRSPYTKRRDCEGVVIYQLLLNGEENLKSVVDKCLDHIQAEILDINLGCPAPSIRKMKGGFELFDDYDRLEKMIEVVRDAWPKPLTVKCRLGRDHPGWRDAFVKRIALFEKVGIDSITVHPRFSKEKLKRNARWSEFPWINSLTSLPIIANGDIKSKDDLKNNADFFADVSGIMIGRMAVIQPWVFRDWEQKTNAIDYKMIWFRYFDYVREDFLPAQALGRIKEFTGYFSRNFTFGHRWTAQMQNAETLTMCENLTRSFFDLEPPVNSSPSIRSI